MSANDFTRVTGQVETIAHWMPGELEKMAMHRAAIAFAERPTKKRRAAYRQACKQYDAAMHAIRADWQVMSEMLQNIDISSLGAELEKGLTE